MTQLEQFLLTCEQNSGTWVEHSWYKNFPITNLYTAGQLCITWSIVWKTGRLLSVECDKHTSLKL